MKIGILVATLTLLLVVFGSTMLKGGAEQGAEQIVVRVYERADIVRSEIVISYGGEKTEVVELKAQKPKNRNYNTDRINYVLNKIRKSGFSINSSVAASSGPSSLMSTYVFVSDN